MSSTTSAFEVSFESEDSSNDELDLSGDEDPYLIVQRQFEDDDGGVSYIETHDHDTYSGHFRLRLIRFTPTRFAFEIARKDHKYVEVTYDLDAQRFYECGGFVKVTAWLLGGSGGRVRSWFRSPIAGTVSRRP